MRLGTDYDPVGQQESGDFDVACEECGSENPCLLSGSLCCLVACAFIAYFSLGAVPPLTLGIAVNAFTKAADTTTVYRPGRYFIGPTKSFLYFPSDVRTIEFTNQANLVANGVRYTPLHTRTKEGLGLHLQVALQYRLIPDDVGKLYNEFNQNYEQVFISAVRDVLIKAASEYDANQLWQERAKFGNRMQDMVNTALTKTYATCWGLQLMLIELPTKYEESIVSTQVQQQSRLLLQQQQLSARIRAETSVIKADFDRQTKVILAMGKGNYTLTTQTANAQAQQRTVDAQTEAVKIVKTTLGLDGPELVMYQRYDAVNELPGSTIFFGFGGSPQVLVNSGGGI